MTAIRVLVADDHTLVREGTRELLDRQPDIEVVAEASNGSEAVVLAERFRPDVALVDIEMPGLNGIEATESIVARCPEVKVLALTVHDNAQYVGAVIDAGAAGYLLKDVPSGKLVEAVRSVHEGESVLHPAVVGKVFDHLRGDDEAVRPPNDLTPRELEIVAAAARGWGNKRIARELGLSVRTVHAHFNHIFTKLAVTSRTEAVVYALRRQWVTLEELS